METTWYRCNTLYYIREKCYGKSKKIAIEASSKVTESSEFLFYHGLCSILEGQIHKGINELTPLQSDRDLELAVVMALVFSYKLVNSYDREDLLNLETKLKEEKKQANAVSFYYAALFLSLGEKYEKASEYINKALRKDPNNLNTIILKGWNDMFMSIGELKPSVLDCFELVSHKSDNNVEALVGIAKFKYLTKKYDSSNLTLDKLVVNNPGQVVPLVEKLRNEFAAQKWEAVYDTIERVLSLDPKNIEALKIRIFIALCKNSDYIEAVDQLNKFFSVLESEETNNGHQFYITAQLFSKICGRSSAVLSQVYRFAQYASEMYSSNVDYLSEVGYQCILQGKYKDALNFFKAASKVDCNSITALCGLTLCQMFDNNNGPTNQIAEQVELLYEMQGTNKFPILYLLSAQLNKNSNAETFLNNAIESQISQTDSYPYSMIYVKKLDPDFLLEVYKEYKKHLPKKPFVVVGHLLYTQEGNHAGVANCFKMLSTICDSCPGLIPALYELAKLKFLFGYSNEAQMLAQQIGDLDNTHAGSQVLLAQIYIQQGAYTKAVQSLEMCLSYNFKIRDSAMYHFLNGVILKNMNQTQDALSSLNTSLQIVNNKNNIRQYDSGLNIIDKSTLFLEIIELQTSLEQFGEAGKTMQEAIQEISYTSEGSRLLIARADLALNNGDIDKAIEFLNDVKAGQPYYFQAHSKMAHIYLKQKQDRGMFTSCFKDIVNNHPMVDAHTMMGDAFMSIHEPIQAAASYETAIKGNPKDIQLIKKLGTALVKMHEYDKATLHYENSVKALNNDELRFEYLELLIKLKQYDKVDSTISSELNQIYNKEKDVQTLKRRVKLLLIQASSRELKNPTASNTNLILTEAKDLQMSILKRMEIDSRGDLDEEKKKLSSILCLLAKVKSVKEPALATNLYSEALIYSPRDPDTLLALAKLYAQMNNPERCEQTCSVLLNADPNNESAAVMMADLAFRKVDLETAQRHLNQILSVKPTSFEALSQLIEVQWRRGSLQEAERALQEAERALEDSGTDHSAGYSYCRGVFEAYSCNVNAALRRLNASRRSPWGAAAARRMLLLCLAQATDQSGTSDDDDTRLLALRTAEKLLCEVCPSERRSLGALLQLASRQKPQADRVLQELLPAATDDGCQDDPYLILAVANAYNILKQPTRAKNVLKRSISSVPWTPEKADGLERCWLEVVDNQINSGRTDAAKEMLSKILHHNKSCAKAHQYLGLLAEKDQNYKSAVLSYDSAWRLSGSSDAGAGARLAAACLRLKKYPECIVVCRHILKAHPDYPKIKKEILEKAKTNLRT